MDTKNYSGVGGGYGSIHEYLSGVKSEYCDKQPQKKEREINPKTIKGPIISGLLTLKIILMLNSIFSNQQTYKPGSVVNSYLSGI